MPAPRRRAGKPDPSPLVVPARAAWPWQQPLRSGLVLLLFLALPAVVQAQQRATPKEAPAGKMATRPQKGVASGFLPTGWQVRCRTGDKDGKVFCVLDQAIIERRSRRVLLRISIPGDRRSMTLQLPHGLDLRQPVVLQVDKATLGKAPFVTSRRNGAYARLPLDAKRLEALRRGKTLAVHMKIFNGREFIVQMNLRGFAAALKKLAQ